MGILRDKLFHLRAAVTGLVRNLPITIALLAAASFLSTVFFHFSQNVTNISIIFILAIILIAPEATEQASWPLCTVFFG